MVDIDDILRDFEVSTAKPSQELDYQKLVRAWKNERLTPDLLAYETQLIEMLLERVRMQIEYIELNSIQLQSEKEIKLMLVIVETEVNRINFLIRSYLRTRLAKIDKYAVYIRTEESEIKKLSHDEFAYMESHLKLLVELYNSFLGKIPESLTKLDDTSGGISMITQPDLKTVVFVKVLRSHEATVDGEQIELEPGAIYALRYEAVKEFFELGDVEII